MHISQNIYYTKALECFIKISRMVHTEIQLFVKVILSSLQTSSDTFANSADPDETARDEPSYQDIHDLPFCLIFFLLKPLFATKDVSESKDWIVHVKNYRVKGLNVFLNKWSSDTTFVSRV